MEQSVLSDTNNSSTTNLDAGNAYTFSGSATSTLGVVGLQWSLKTDQNATVYIDQSPDNVHWDISDTANYIASKGGRGETVQATQSYWRIRVVLTGTTQTSYFRLSGVLCPIAMPMASSLTTDGRAKVSSSFYDPISDIRGKVTPFGKMKTVEPMRIIGTAFSGSTIDTNFWTSTSECGVIGRAKKTDLSKAERQKLVR